MSYWESHITIEPVFNEKLAAINLITEVNNFHVVSLLMKKGVEDIEESKYDVFITVLDI